MTTAESPAPDGDVVAVSVPADVSYVATLRLATASLATRCGLTIDDIEDLRLAVDEACALLLPHAANGSTLDARFGLSTGRLDVTVGVAATGAAQADRVDQHGFSWTVLGALASSVELRDEDDRLLIEVSKIREVATP